MALNDRYKLTRSSSTCHYFTVVRCLSVHLTVCLSSLCKHVLVLYLTIWQTTILVLCTKRYANMWAGTRSRAGVRTYTPSPFGQSGLHHCGMLVVVWRL